MRSLAVVMLAAVAMFFVGMTARPLANSQAPIRDVKRGPSGLPLPRYVSLKASRANLRVGPGTEYTVSWLYTRPGLPMEIIQEYDHWRHVRDAQGTEGWIYQSLLSGERTAEAAPWLEGRVSQTPTYVLMHKGPRKNSAVIAKLEPGVILRLSECNGEWCHAGINGTDGWVEQADLWGAYPDEVFK